MRWIEDNVSFDGPKCLLWPFSRLPDGRGHMTVNGSTVYPSRIMCEKIHGQAPTAKHEAAHSCGNGHLACVHPKHIRWATNAENNADKIIHGTIPKGEQLPQAKLTEKKVRQIRSLAMTVQGKDLAKRFGVHGSCISKIINRTHWKHIR